MRDKRSRHFYSRHHRRCRSNGGDDSFANISRVSKVQHECWHTLFSNMKPPDIATLINEVWIGEEYIFVCEKTYTR